MASPRKGISQTLIIMMLIFVAFSVSLFGWVFMSQYTETLAGCIKILDFKGDTFFLQNCGPTDIQTFDLYINDVPVPVFESDKIILEGETRQFTATFLPNDGVRIIKILTNVAVTAVGWPVPRAWIVDAEFHFKIIEGDPSLLINGTVHLNTKAAPPYANRELHYSVDNIINDTLTTNEQGQFNFTKPWNFTALYPGQWWLVMNTFTKPFDSKILEPPGRVDFDGFEVGTHQAYIRLDDKNYVIGRKEIVPFNISNDTIIYSFNSTITTTNDITVPGPTDKIYYGSSFNMIKTTIDSAPHNYTIDCLSIIDGTDGNCVYGNSSAYLATDLDGKTFNATNIQSDGNGDYIDFYVNVSHLPIIAGLNLSSTPFFSKVKVQLYINSTNVSPGLPIDGYTFNDVKLVRMGKTKVFDLRIYMEDIHKELLDRYNETSSNGSYFAWISAYPPESHNKASHVSLFVNFSINGTVTSYCDYTPLTQYVNLCLLPSRSKTVLWEIPAIAKNTEYQFEFRGIFDREPDAWTLEGTPEHLYFVDATGDVLSYYIASSGMIENATDDSLTTNIDIPGLSDTVYAYTFGLPGNVDSTTAEVMTRTYLLNTGTNLVSDTVVYSVRGEMKTCNNNLEKGESLFCNLTENPRPGETTQNMVHIKMTGYNVTFDYTVNQLNVDNCNMMNPSGKECAGRITSCRGNYCTFLRCGPNLYCNDTKNAEGDNVLYSDVNITSQIFNSTTITSLYLWNWYTNQTPLWTNHDDHMVIFTTIEPEPYYPGTFYFPFST